MTVARSTISNNRGPNGGGIYNGGTLMLTSSSVEGNTGNYGGYFPNNSGGGIFNAGQLTLRATFVTNNTLLPGGDGDGGGIFNTDPGTVTIHGGGITGNTPNDCVGC